MLKTYKIIPVNGKYQVSEANDQPMVWWDSEELPLMVEFDTFHEAAAGVNSMIDNESDHNDGWDAYGEQKWGC